MAELLQLILRSYGVIGVLMALPYIGVFYLWKENQRLHRTMLDLSGTHAQAIDQSGVRLTEVQEKRIADAQGLSTKLMALMTERSSLDKETNLALDRIGDMVSMVVHNTHYSTRREREPRKEREKGVPG